MSSALTLYPITAMAKHFFLLFPNATQGVYPPPGSRLCQKHVIESCIRQETQNTFEMVEEIK